MRILLTFLLGAASLAAQTAIGGRIFEGLHDTSVAQKVTSPRLLTSDPPTCDATKREVYFNTTTNKLRICLATNTWSDMGGAAAYAPANGFVEFPFGQPPTDLTGEAVSSMLPRYVGISVRGNFAGAMMAADMSGGGYLTGALYYQATCAKVPGSDTVPVTGGFNWWAMLVDNGGAGKVTPGDGDYLWGYVIGGSGSQLHGVGKNYTPDIVKAAAAAGFAPQYFIGSNAATGSGSSITMPATCGSKTPIDSTMTILFPVLATLRK